MQRVQFVVKLGIRSALYVGRKQGGVNKIGRKLGGGESGGYGGMVGEGINP